MGRTFSLDLTASPQANWLQRLATCVCLYVRTYVCVRCTYLCGLSVCPCVSVEVGGSSLIALYYFLRQGISINLELTNWLHWPANEHQESACLCLPRHIASRLLHGFWGFNLVSCA